MTEAKNTFARWLIIAPVSYLIGFVIFTRPFVGDFHRILNQSGIGKELRVAYLIALGVLSVGTVWAFLVQSGIEIKILGLTALLIGLLLIPAVLAIVEY